MVLLKFFQPNNLNEKKKKKIAAGTTNKQTINGLTTQNAKTTKK